MKKRQTTSALSAIQIALSLLLISISIVLAIAATHNPAASQRWGTSNARAAQTNPAAITLAPSTTPLTQSLDVPEHKMTIRYPDNWSVGPKRLSNMQELLNMPAEVQGRAPILTKIKVRHQNRIDHADALNELAEISKETKDPVTFLTIGDRPAMQRAGLEERQQPDEGPRFSDEYMIRVTTAIADGNSVIRIDALLPSDADAKLLGDTSAIARGITFAQPGNASGAERDLQALRTRTAPSQTAPVTPAGPSIFPRRPSNTQPAPGQINISALPSGESPDSGPGASRVFNGGNGELEMVVSQDAKTVIIGRQNNWITSKDGGQTFPFSGSLNFGDGDPSLAQGKSGNYYIAGIRTGGGGCTFPGVDPNPTHTFGYTCTGFRRSTDGGQTFPVLSNSVVCPNDKPGGPPTVADRCFPDQEHIAADLFNAGGSGDQVYSTWRNFDAADQDPAIVCSQDSGVTWTAAADVDSGFIPRIGVGQNGFVYVVYRSGGNIRLNKYSSCASGLAAQPGFPLTIATVTDVTCPVAGLDRCNDGNNLSSIMVAVDDTNPNHVYVAYGNETAAGNQDILVRDSLDGGATWPGPRVVRVNTAVPAVRFMPWISTTQGTAYVTWYDRRAATPCPAPPCAANNDLTDFYASSANLDGGGNLAAGTEIKLTNGADPQCAGGKTPGSSASWPCNTRSTGDSETCSVQPQLAGVCCDNTMPGCPGSQQRCDFSSGPACPGGETCNGGGGCPKYGDYNGNAAAGGRLFAAWASAVPPTGIAASGNIDVFFASKLVANVPVISVPGTLNFPDTCVNSTSNSTLNVCNTGKADLEANSITSDNTQFTVTAPSSGYPVVISPDFCYPFQAKFTPTSTGAKTANITIASNDPTSPSVVVQATGTGGTSSVRVTGSTSFGDVCTGGTAEKTISVCNTGSCDLHVTSAAFSPACPDFTLVNNPFPATISHGSCLDLTIRFTPTSTGSKSCTLVVSSDDPTNPTVNISVTANTPSGAIGVAPDQAFPPTVIQSTGACSSARPFPISNTGACTVKVTNVSLSGPNPGDYAFSGLPTLPTVLGPGDVLGSGGFSLLFKPTAIDRNRLATISVTYETDPTTGATATINRALAGEGVNTGVRLLVTQGGVPVPVVDKIYLKRIKKRQIKPNLVVNDTVTNVPLQSVTPTPPGVPFQFHREWGGVSNPVQLLPTDYQLQVTLKVAGKKVTKTVAFSVGTCDFNPNIVVNF